MPIIDPALKRFATDTQAAYIDAVNQHGSSRKAAKIIGCHPSAINRAIAAVKRKASAVPHEKEGWTPVEVTEHFDDSGNLTGKSVRSGPEDWADQGGIGAGPERDGHSGYAIKGVSTYYNASGEQRGQWVKTKTDEIARDELIRAAFASMAAELPRAERVGAPLMTSAALCNLYTMTDCHVGMLAWHKEGGADWDLAIAERVLGGCFEEMVRASPPASSCVINQLGDWLHQDSIEPVTPASRHLLDSDSRFQKIVGASLRILRRLVDVALAKHETVYVIMAEGNHDTSSSIWMRVMFAALYENEPRVIVNDSALPYYVHQHGSTMLAFHHGHLKKGDGLPLLFAAEFPKVWGGTTKRYVHSGHWHHELVKEFAGMKHIQHPTLSARDAYASRHGYLSERQATAYTYHIVHGQVASVTVTPEMLAA